MQPGPEAIVVVEEKRSQQLSHVPFDVVGQHAKQDVSADAIRQPVVNGPHMQVDGLETAKGSFHSREAFITGHDLFAGQGVGFDAGANDVDPVQALLAFDVGLFALVVEAVFFDSQLKVLAHLIAVEDLAGAHPDILLAA